MQAVPSPSSVRPWRTLQWTISSPSSKGGERPTAGTRKFTRVSWKEQKMADKAKVVLTDYVWESLDVEKDILSGLAELVPLQTKNPKDFLGEASDCDALLNTYAGPI